MSNTTYKSDVAGGERRSPVPITWSDQKILGSGQFGVVILQKAGGDVGELRAVKKIYTGLGKIDFSREIVVMAKVAHVCIRTSAL